LPKLASTGASAESPLELLADPDQPRAYVLRRVYVAVVGEYIRIWKITPFGVTLTAVSGLAAWETSQLSY